MSREYISCDYGVKFSFKQTPKTFKVIENSNIKLLKRADFRLYKAHKTSISTMEMVEYLSSVLKIDASDIGYAGLKDKHASTTQYITLPKYVNSKKFKNTQRVTLEEVGLCSKRLRVGELISNSFEIILEDIDLVEYGKIKSQFLLLQNVGFPNFFGYQRFGVLDDSSDKGERISKDGKGSKNQNSKILLAAYQAKSFNEWLNKRLYISNNVSKNLDNKILQHISPNILKELDKFDNKFKLLPGDLGYVYAKKGKKNLEVANDLKKYTDMFLSKKYNVTGVLFGSSVRFSTSIAGEIERKFIDYSFNALRGARRVAWVWPRECYIEYNKDNRSILLKFTLPPGSYATVLLEELKKDKL